MVHVQHRQMQPIDPLAPHVALCPILACFCVERELPSPPQKKPLQSFLRMKSCSLNCNWKSRMQILLFNWRIQILE